MKRSSQSGQALILLMVFMVITIIVTSASVILVVINSTNASKFEQSETAYDAAEAGMENALLRLLRDPNYNGETLTVGTATATITVSGSGTQTITSVGRYNNYIRKVQVVLATGDADTIQSWTEVF